jgi:hypothetical protein
MKRSVLGLLCIAAITSAAVAGTETYSGKEIKQMARMAWTVRVSR